MCQVEQGRQEEEGEGFTQLHVQCTHTHPVTALSFGKDWSHTPVPLAEVQKREVCVQQGGGRAEIMQRINEIRTRQGQIMYHYTPETKGQHPEG